MVAPSPGIPASVALDTRVPMPQEPPVFGTKISHSSLSSCWHYRCSCWHYRPPTCGLHNYCTQTLHYTHVHRKKIRNKVNKKFDQIKLLECRMWLEKCGDHTLLIFKQPALLSLVLLFSTQFFLPNSPISIPFPAFCSISYHPILCPVQSLYMSHSPRKHHPFSWQDPSCLTHHDGFQTCKIGLRVFWDSHEKALNRISFCLNP